MRYFKPSLMVMLAGCAAAAGPADIAKLDWLAGHWCLESDGRFIEEYWLPARGGRIVAMGRTTVNGQARGFEYSRIEMRDGVITFIAQPEGDAPVPFRLTSSGESWAVFENPAHDFPKRVEYRRTERGLFAQISGPGSDGRIRAVDFDYAACRSR